MTHSTPWTATDLTRFGDAQEVRIAGTRTDGSLRKPVIVWAVRVGDDLYTRSVNGPDAAWFRGTRATHQGQLSAGSSAIDVDIVDAVGLADDEIDAVYRRKYGRYPGPVVSITGPVARTTTLKLVPRQPKQDNA
jgi:hypothetical protein